MGNISVRLNVRFDLRRVPELAEEPRRPSCVVYVRLVLRFNCRFIRPLPRQTFFRSVNPGLPYVLDIIFPEISSVHLL